MTLNTVIGCVKMLPEIDPQPCRGQFKERLWEDNNYWAEHKFHGCRYLLYSDGRLLSRHASVKGTGFVDKIDRTPHLAAIARALPAGTILDGEVVSHDFGTVRDVTSILGSSPELAIQKQHERGFLEYRVFDIPYIENLDLRKDELFNRRQALEFLFQRYTFPYMKIAEITRYHKKEYYASILEQGGEGIILKNKYSKYGEQRYWVKAKGVEDFDVFISGYKPAEQYSKKVSGIVSETEFYINGWIGAVEMSMIDAITGQEVFVGTCSGFTRETRKFISDHKEECLGRVITIMAQSQLKSGKFENPRFDRWREDKHKSECILVPEL